MVDGDFVLSIVEDPIVVRRTVDLERAASGSSALLRRKRKCKSEDQFAVSAVREQANPPRLVLPYGVKGHTSGAPRYRNARIGRSGGYATKRGADSFEKGFNGLLRRFAGQRG